MNYRDRASLCFAPIAAKLFHLMADKETNLSVSADVTESRQLIELAHTLGPEICVLKTHIDILQDFTPAVIAELETAAKKHHFMIFEDRKFADIGNTVKHQYGGGIYHIADWAHITNAHTLPGPGIIAGLAEVGLPKERGLLLLAEMSSEGHLLDESYKQKTLAMANVHKDFVIGFITQHAFLDAPHFINMTPGVQFPGKNKDQLGQRYNDPEHAILELGSDIIIVGRGIIADSNPQAAAKAYRDAGWQAYLQRTQA